MRLALLVLGFAFGVAAHADDHRADFKAGLAGVSESSQNKPIACVEGASGQPTVKVNYTLTLEAYSDLQDAYFVHFKSADGAHEWSTLVAYEGHDGDVIGSLSMTQQGPMVRYQHLFQGALEDQLSLNVNNGKATELMFRKTASRRTVIQYVNCLL